MKPRILAGDHAGRYSGPFLNFLVWCTLPIDDDPQFDSMDRHLKESWGATYLAHSEKHNVCSYLEFETPEQMTAFCLRWGGCQE